jgi:hypothetical protein
MMKRVLMAVAILAASAYPLMTAYKVEPVKASWSGMADPRPDYGISQTITCNWDHLDSATGGYVELFAGDHGAGGSYHLNISEPGGGQRVAYHHGVTPGQDYDWVRFGNIQMEQGRSFTKGKTYEFRFTRSGSDSIEYYWDTGDAYAYGYLTDPSAPESRDLAMRVYGVMDTIGADWFGANFSPFRQTGDPLERTLSVAVDSIGLGWLRSSHTSWTFVEGPVGTFHFSGVPDSTDSIITHRGLDRLGLLAYCLNDSLVSTRDVPGNSARTCRPLYGDKYPPRNLWAYPDTALDSPNYWLRYVRTVLDSMPNLTSLEIWNEANVCSIYFGNPHPAYYSGSTPGPLEDGLPGAIDTPRERCSLYVRMCYLAKEAAGVDGPMILAGSVSGIFHVGPEEGVSRGIDWIADMFDIAEREYGGWQNCFDGISIHPYQGGRPYSDTMFRNRLDAVRAEMTARGAGGAPLWITEMGWQFYKWDTTESCYVTCAGADPYLYAHNLAEFWVEALASWYTPAGGCDRVFWWEMSDLRMRYKMEHGGFGLLDSAHPDLGNQTRKPMSYSLEQLIGTLTGKRLNGRVMLGDYRDTLVGIYEFEDPGAAERMWVAWRNGDPSYGNNEPPPIDVSIPVRTDATEWEYCAYGSGNQRESDEAGVDGWFDVSLTTRPRFILEPETSTVARPDLVADSVWTVPPLVQVSRQCSLYVRVANHGSAATKAGSPITGYPNTVARFYVNDSLVGTWEHSPGIGIGGSVRLGIGWTPVAAGTVLLRATVNDDQAYVEEGLDDNAAFRSFTISN